MAVQDNVARGAQWLDEVAPDWFDRVDLSTLDFWTPTSCIAGQVFRDVRPYLSGYHAMLAMLSPQLNADVTYGFTHPDGGDVFTAAADSKTHAELVQLWTAEITNRRQQPEVAQ